MPRLSKLIRRTLSFRLTLRVMLALAALLMAALLTMFWFSRKAVKEEVLLDASQTLEATVEKIDNILLSVEQAAGNVYWKMIPYIDQPEKLNMFADMLKERNPYVTSCDIVWSNDTTLTMGWTAPKTQSDAITIFRLPLLKRGQKVGSMDVGVSQALLWNILLETKPSQNSFCTLLRKDGSIMIHPDSNVLNKNILSLASHDDHSMIEAAQAMLEGEKWLSEGDAQGRGLLCVLQTV